MIWIALLAFVFLAVVVFARVVSTQRKRKADFAKDRQPYNCVTIRLLVEEEFKMKTNNGDKE